MDRGTPIIEYQSPRGAERRTRFLPEWLDRLLGVLLAVILAALAVAYATGMLATGW